MGTDGLRRAWIVRQAGASAVLALACAVVLTGCGRPAAGPEGRGPQEPSIGQSETFELEGGELLRLAYRLKGADSPPGLSRSPDGVYRLPEWGANQPALYAPAPHTIKLQVTAPEGTVLRTGFGLLPEGREKPGVGVRFTVRVGGAKGVEELLSQEVRLSDQEDASRWTPVSLALPAAAGERLEVELTSEPLGSRLPGAPTDSASGYSVWVNPSIAAPAEGGKPNIVLIVVDALRADHLGCYGYDRETSPFLDDLSRESVVFEDVTAQGTYTLASMSSLLTSSYPLVIGATLAAAELGSKGGEEAGEVVHPVDMSASLQAGLGRAGYSTLASVGGGFLHPVLGFSSGYDWYWSADPRKKLLLADQLSELKQHLVADHPVPFFLLLHTYEVHNYLQGWAHCLAEFDHGYLGPLTDPDHLFKLVISRKAKGLSQSDLQYLQDIYDGEILHTDHYLRLFLGWLLSQPWAQNTIVVITADHGEAFGEHDILHHGDVPYWEVSRVPLLIRFPEGRWRGRRAAEPVGLVDLMPSLLELGGGEPPEECMGRSLMPLLRGEEATGRRAMLSECSGKALLARDGRWAYLVWFGHEWERLYDMAVDRRQTKDLAQQRPEEVRRMRRVLASLLMEAGRGYRVVVAGRRAHAVTIELDCSGEFSYFLLPTAGAKIEGGQTDADSGPDSGPTAARTKPVKALIPAGDDPHVLLFEAADPNDEVRVSATIGDKAVEVSRFHVGDEEVAPDRLPVVVGGRPLVPWFTAERAPVGTEPDEWGIWLWRPSRLARPLTTSGAGASKRLSGDLRDQLRGLGYLR
jgi:hypothetical protein